MSSSRARSRFAAIAAAVPLLIAGGPLVAPAYAANEYTVTNLLADGQVVGPNTGYLGLGVGETGTTAMFKVSPPSTAATIESLELTLTQLDNPGTYIYQNELDTTDGLSLYEDVNDNGAFDAADKATGLKSNGFRAGRPAANGDIPFVVTLAGPASGAADYFVAIHPASTAVSGRRFTFKVDIGDVAGSGGNGPVNAVTTPANTDQGDKRMVVDSAAPTTPGREAFTPVSNVPGIEDKYAVPPVIAGGDANVRAIFFNADNTSAPNAILTRPGYDATKLPTEQLDKLAWEKVVDSGAPTQPNDIPIGDGSGLFHGVAGVAKNNQVSNAVYARLVDAAGNLSATVVLSDCFVAPNTTACEVARGNPVIGPEAPTDAVLGTATTSKIVAINKANQASVPVAVTTSQNSVNARTNRANAGPTNADTSSKAVKARARVVEVASGAANEDYVTATKDKDWSGTAIAFTAANETFDTTLQETAPRGIREGKGNSSAWAVNVDRAGNPSQPKLSASPFYTKDITAPTASVHSPVANPAPGQDVTVLFSEPMDKATITTVAPNQLGVCSDNVADNSAEKVLDVADNLTGLSSADRTWGYGYCFEWGSDGTAATITVGEDRRPPECAITPADDCVDLAAVGDVVKYGTGANELTDAAGNPAVGEGASPFHTTIVVPPATITLAETRDANADGRLDGIYAEFSGVLDMTTVNNSLANFSAVSGTTVPITSATIVSGDASKILFGFTSEFSTGEAPELRLSVPSGQNDTGVKDGDGDLISAFSKAAADKAMPQPKSARTVDENKDGQIDKVTVTYSEKIQHAQDNNPADSNVNGPAYHVVGYAPASQPGRTETFNTADPKTGESQVKTLTLTRPNASLDTGARPVTKFTRYTQPVTNEVYGPTDLSDNAWGDADNVWTLTPDDGVAPVYATRFTRDLDADGKVDAIDLKFSENIPTVATGATFEVAGRQILDQFGQGTDGIRILIDETAPATGDTAASMAPTIKHVTGVQDAFGNAMPADANPVTVSDGAGPAIMAACPSSPKGSNGKCPEDDPAVATDDGAKMNVFFSEALTAGTVAAADFVVEQPAGATPAKAVTGTPTVNNAADGKSSVVGLAFAAGTLSNTVDSVVRLSGAGVVADAANVVSTQVSNVTAYAPPTVDLALSCPEPANAGYCGVTTITTGATGSPGVIQWRLKETARGTTVDPADYSTTKPTTVTLVEGPHTLYLSGMDDLGRLSPEKSGSITILKAPKILNVQFVNSGPRDSNDWSRTTTVMDGDNVKIGADAYGTDAAEWAANSQPIGGGCLAQHMSIDARALTGRTSDGTVAPLKCDLISTTTPPYRQMQFPVVKVLGTTKYPVGTVIRTGTSDPGSLIVDGPNGTQRRRQFISANARRSWTISDASVITVPSALLTAIPRTTNLGYRDGAVLKSPSGGYYYVHSGVKRPVSTTQLAAWRIPTSVAYPVSVGELNATPTGTKIASATHQVGTWIKYSNGTIYQIVRKSNGATVRRQLAAGAALRTRVPANQVYPANSYDSKLPVDSWLLGYRDGTVVKLGTNSYGVFARGSLRKFANPETFNTLGYSTSNALAFSGAATSRVRGASYRTGLGIDRYKITSTVIKVTNKAGATVTATVVPAVGGVYGVGQVDPIPAGWDMTR